MNPDRAIQSNLKNHELLLTQPTNKKKYWEGSMASCFFNQVKHKQDTI